jgi:hypothetical protein
MIKKERTLLPWIVILNHTPRTGDNDISFIIFYSGFTLDNSEFLDRPFKLII